jgi:hypothetical protein
MKVEQLIVQYLYNNKKVTIQDIGSFTLSPDVVIPTDKDKESGLPEGSIHFEFNSKAEKEEGLIDFIIEHSRKIRPLATSDLESYSILSRQFLNIGKPLVIEGLGTLQKNQQGHYDFTQGHTINPKLENNPTAVKDKIQDEISFSTPPREPASGRGLMLIVVALFLLSSAAALYYFFVFNKNKDLPIEQTAILPAENDTLSNGFDTTALQKIDSLIPPAKDTVTMLPPQNKDGYTFKVVLKEYPSKEAANKAFDRLTTYGHKVILSQKDTTTYKIAIPFTSPLSDTLRAKDSLKIFFGGKPYIEL